MAILKLGIRNRKSALAVLFGTILLFTFQNCAPTTFEEDAATKRNQPGPADISSFQMIQPETCSSENSVEFEFSYEKGKSYFCQDETKLSEPLGPICELGPTITDFLSSTTSEPCESIKLCGVEPSSIEISFETERMQTLHYQFKNLPLGCSGQIRAIHQPKEGEESLPEQLFDINVSGGSCRTCEFNGMTSCGACENTAENCTAPGKIFLEGKCIDQPNLSPDVEVTAKSVYDEGEVAFFNVSAENVSDGTELNFKVTGTGINKDARDFANNGVGTFKFESNKGKFSLSILKDYVSEGDEIANVIVSNKDEVILTKSITIKDTTRSPTPVLTGPTQLNEGETIVYSISAPELPSGSILYYKIEGTKLNQGSTDFKTSTRSTFTVKSGIANLTLTANADLFTEGEETVQLIIYNSGGSLTQKTIYINDTSLSPTAELRAPSEMDEGDSRQVQLDITGVPVGTLLNYAVVGTGINQGNPDFENSGRGSIAYTANPVIIPLSAIADLKTEGDEILTFKVSFAGRALIEKTIVLHDTSRAVSIGIAAPGVINEGDLLAVNLAAAIPDGTTLTYKVSGSGINSGTLDFVNKGEGSVEFINGQAQIQLFAINDEKTEGMETFVLSVNSLGGRLAEKSININDTSTIRPGQLNGPTALAEGGHYEYNFTAPGAVDGSSVNWKLTPLGSANLAGDFKYINGVLKVYAESGAFNLDSIADLKTEGSEYYTLTVYSAMGTIAELRLSMTDDSPFPRAVVTGSFEVNEGSTYEYVFTSNDIPEGTKISYRSSGAGINSGGLDIIGSGTGSFLMTAGSNPIQLQYIPDLKTEGVEYLTLSFSISSGVVVERIIKINDTSVVPFGTLTASRSFDEGANVALTYSTPSFLESTALKYKVTGTGINLNGLDFANSGAGSFTLVNGNATINLNVLADLRTEGTETFNFIIYNDYGTLLSKSFTIADTSKGSSLSFDSSPSIAIEGTELTLNLSMSGVPDGAIVNYILTGALITAQDFLPAQTTGNFTVNNGLGQIVLRIVNDGIVEGDENLTVTVVYAGQTITKNITLRDP